MFFFRCLGFPIRIFKKNIRVQLFVHSWHKHFKNLCYLCKSVVNPFPFAPDSYRDTASLCMIQKNACRFGQAFKKLG
jgi:hypothetical protein